MGRTDYITEQSVIVHADSHKVWDALTNPALIKQYLFGTDVVSDWKIGGKIVYRGEWQGKPYEDKGIILNIVPEKVLDTNYWSGMSGLPDKPEYYKRVCYELSQVPGGTKITITQDGNSSEDERSQSGENWKMVLNIMKEILEK